MTKRKLTTPLDLYVKTSINLSFYLFGKFIYNKDTRSVREVTFFKVILHIKIEEGYDDSEFRILRFIKKAGNKCAVSFIIISLLQINAQNGTPI